MPLLKSWPRQRGRVGVRALAVVQARRGSSMSGEPARSSTRLAARAARVELIGAFALMLVSASLASTLPALWTPSEDMQTLVSVPASVVIGGPNAAGAAHVFDRWWEEDTTVSPAPASAPSQDLVSDRWWEDAQENP